MKKRNLFKSLGLVLPMISITLSACGKSSFEQKYGYRENDPDSVIAIGPDKSDYIKDASYDNKKFAQYYNNFLVSQLADFRQLYKNFPQIIKNKTIDLTIFKNLKWMGH